MMSLPDSNLANPPARGVFVEKPRANAYTAMLVLSFVALVIGCICLAAEMKSYDWDFKAASAKTVG
jgi:hypothetical protein